MENLYREEFELEKIPFTDKELEIEITLFAKGIVEFTSSADGERISSTKQVLSALIAMIITTLGKDGAGYDDIQRRPFLPFMKEFLAESYEEDVSLELKNIYFTEIHPSDDDYIKIIEAKRLKKQKAASSSTAAPSSGSGPSSEQSANKRICPSCKADLSDRSEGMQFCPKCGAALAAQTGDHDGNADQGNINRENINQEEVVKNPSTIISVGDGPFLQTRFLIHDALLYRRTVMLDPQNKPASKPLGSNEERMLVDFVPGSVEWNSGMIALASDRLLFVKKNGETEEYDLAKMELPDSFNFTFSGNFGGSFHVPYPNGKNGKMKSNYFKIDSSVAVDFAACLVFLKSGRYDLIYPDEEVIVRCDLLDFCRCYPQNKRSIEALGGLFMILTPHEHNFDKAKKVVKDCYARLQAT